MVSTGLPAAFILAYYIMYKDTTDLIQGLLGNGPLYAIGYIHVHMTLGLVLAFLLNGVILDVIKLSVGR